MIKLDYEFQKSFGNKRSDTTVRREVTSAVDQTKIVPNIGFKLYSHFFLKIRRWEEQEREIAQVVRGNIPLFHQFFYLIQFQEANEDLL